jgi:DNA-binding transcriptional LysR family regulator
VDLTRINTNLLVALDLLLTHQSVARAAELQGVSASAMSHSLRGLRELFDDPLLTRTKRGMVPTPFALRLRDPLRRSLRDLARAVSAMDEFDPKSAKRAFVLAAPDFISTFLLPPVLRVLEQQAPGIDIEVRPIQRAGTGLRLADAAMLADGDIDLAVGAIIDGPPGIRTADLYEESFCCVVRDGHPAVGDELDLATYTAVPHLLITITDERTPTMIDEALAAEGLERRVAARTRFFMSAPLMVAESDLLLTCPRQLGRYFAAHLPLRLLEPPIQLPNYPEMLAWHERFDADPGLGWLRSALHRAAVEVTSGGDAA